MNGAVRSRHRHGVQARSRRAGRPATRTREGGAGADLGRPAETADRFIPHPFRTDGARLFRTGDRARRLASGDLSFIGRVDHQVKIRGHRVELGEIEARLAQHPGIRDAVVLARKDGPLRERLVAYIVPEGPEAPRAAELSAYLQRTLPAHMIPAAFVALSALPLTKNGKVDRRALPELVVRLSEMSEEEAEAMLKARASGAPREGS